MSDIERRFFDATEIRATGDGGGGNKKIVGHAAVFNQEADLGWFLERFEPGAFSETIRNDDVRALFNHNPDFVLGRNRSKTLTLKEDRRGLAIENDPPDTTWARDLQVSIDRGDITQMSIGFSVQDARWEKKDGKELRVIEKVRLFDVSPVAFPAYEGTDVSLRNLDAAKREYEAFRSETGANSAEISPKEAETDSGGGELASNQGNDTVEGDQTIVPSSVTVTDDGSDAGAGLGFDPIEVAGLQSKIDHAKVNSA